MYAHVGTLSQLKFDLLVYMFNIYVIGSEKKENIKDKTDLNK